MLLHVEKGIWEDGNTRHRQISLKTPLLTEFTDIITWLHYLGVKFPVCYYVPRILGNRCVLNAHHVITGNFTPKMAHHWQTSMQWCYDINASGAICIAQQIITTH